MPTYPTARMLRSKQLREIKIFHVQADGLRRLQTMADRGARQMLLVRRCERQGRSACGRSRRLFILDWGIATSVPTLENDHTAGICPRLPSVPSRRFHYCWTYDITEPYVLSRSSRASLCIDRCSGRASIHMICPAFIIAICLTIEILSALFPDHSETPQTQKKKKKTHHDLNKIQIPASLTAQQHTIQL